MGQYTAGEVDGLAEIMAEPHLPRERQDELFRVLGPPAGRRGRLTAEQAAARDELIRTNTRLVVFVAKKYTSRFLNVPMGDLVGYGVQGLIRALEKHDLSKDIAFPTYAVHWIKSFTVRMVSDQWTMVRVPQCQQIRVGKMRKAGASRDEVESDESRRLACLAMRSDATAAYPEWGVADRVDPWEERERLEDIEATRTAVEESLQLLDDRARTIVRLRAGLGGGEPKTLEQVAKILGVTREWVRQIERASWRQMAKSLAEYAPAGYAAPPVAGTKRVRVRAERRIA